MNLVADLTVTACGPWPSAECNGHQHGFILEHLAQHEEILQVALEVIGHAKNVPNSTQGSS
jgi:hypothetical protein